MVLTCDVADRLAIVRSERDAVAGPPAGEGGRRLELAAQPPWSPCTESVGALLPSLLGLSEDDGIPYIVFSTFELSYRFRMSSNPEQERKRDRTSDYASILTQDDAGLVHALFIMFASSSSSAGVEGADSRARFLCGPPSRGRDGIPPLFLRRPVSFLEIALASASSNSSSSSPSLAHLGISTSSWYRLKLPSGDRGALVLPAFFSSGAGGGAGEESRWGEVRREEGVGTMASCEDNEIMMTVGLAFMSKMEEGRIRKIMGRTESDPTETVTRPGAADSGVSTETMTVGVEAEVTTERSRMGCPRSSAVTAVDDDKLASGNENRAVAL